MANEPSINSFVYDRLSFLEYDLNRPCLDTEWLLSTLFDASLLSTSKPPETAALFLRRCVTAFSSAVIPRRAIARLWTRVFAWTRNPDAIALCLDSGFARFALAPE
jgi:hypothetical protein